MITRLPDVAALPARVILVHHVPGPAGFYMTHPGLPAGWAMAALIAVAVIAALAPFARAATAPERFVNLAAVPVLGRVVRFLTATPRPLLILKLVFAGAFVAVIAAGLFGTQEAGRNLATVVTWNLWWTLIVISVFFVGTAWCAVCPWDTIAGWVVKRRLWRRARPAAGLNLPVPRRLRRIWPALVLFIGFTWLELGLGMTASPFVTALLAILMVVLAASSLAVFERKAFCRYGCPVGRTIGFYAQLGLVELRPVDADVCARCTTLECYHGTETVEPCPTHLTMGRFAQNTYCTSCGACVLSCPYANVAWRLRSVAAEARAGARPHWDEAWFMLALWAITTFHGLSMTPAWQEWLVKLGRAIGDSPTLHLSFALGMSATIAGMVGVYVAFVVLTGWVSGAATPFRRRFSMLAFSVLPVAFAYHLAHNLSHLARESQGLGTVLANPLGLGERAARPMSMAAVHVQPVIPEPLLYALQAGLIVGGFWVAVQVLRYRGREILADGHTSGGGPAGWRLAPMLAFLIAATTANVVLLTQQMVMRL